MINNDILNLKTGDVVYVSYFDVGFDGDVTSVPPVKCVIQVGNQHNPPREFNRQLVKTKINNSVVKLATLIEGDVNSVDILKTFHLNEQDATFHYNSLILDAINYHKEEIKELKKFYVMKTVYTNKLRRVKC